MANERPETSAEGMASSHAQTADVARHLRRCVLSMLSSILVSIVLYVVSSWMQSSTDALGKRVLGAKGAMTSYEKTIAQRIVNASDIGTRLSQVGGLTAVKREIETRVLVPLKHSRLFFSEAMPGLDPPRGVLLHGPPGTGKTMLARAIAAEAGVPFVALGLADLENKYFGESSKLLDATFTLARKIQPCVLFFDEIDGMIRQRSDLDQSCVYGFKTEFLTQMDGMQKRNSDSFVVIGCTNCVDKLDPAVKRRLPCQLLVDYPTRDELVEVFATHLPKTGGIAAEELRTLVSTLRGRCSGSDVAYIVKTAWQLQLDEKRSSDDFRRILDDPRSTPGDMQRLVGDLTLHSLARAVQKVGLADQSPPQRDGAATPATVEDDSDVEEAPPPSVPEDGDDR